MVGRLFTAEDEIDNLHEDLGRARRYLNSLTEDGDEIRKAWNRVQALERELAEKIADQIAAAEGFARPCRKCWDVQEDEQ